MGAQSQSLYIPAGGAMATGRLNASTRTADAVDSLQPASGDSTAQHVTKTLTLWQNAGSIMHLRLPQLLRGRGATR